MLNLTADQKAAFNPNDGQGARTILWECAFEYTNEDVVISSITASGGNGTWAPINNMNDGEKDIISYATFEMGGWPLNGSAVVLPETSSEMQTPSNMPYFGNAVSDENGNYSQSQWVRYLFATAQSLPAITIYWGTQPPIEYTVNWYAGNMTSLIESFTVTENTESHNQIIHGVNGVRSVEIIITKGQPFTRYKVVEFQMGATLIFNKDNSESMTLNYETDFFSERTAASSIEVVTENFGQAFDIFNPQALYAYFKDNMKLTARIGAVAENGSTVWCPMGTFYLKAPTSESNLDSITLRGSGPIDFLKNIRYPIDWTRSGLSVDRLASDMSSALEVAASSTEFDPAASTRIYSKYNYATPTISCADLLALGCNNSYYRGTSSQFHSHYCMTEQRDGSIRFRYINPNKPTDVSFTKLDYDEGNGLSVETDEYCNAVRGIFKGASATPTNITLAEIVSTAGAPSTEWFTDHAIIRPAGGGKEVVAYFEANSLQGGTRYTSNNGTTYSIMLNYRPDQEQEIEKIQPGVESSQVQYFDVPQNAAVRFGGVFGEMNNIDPALYLDFYYRYKIEKRLIAKMNYRGYPYIDIGDVATFDVGNGETQKFLITKLTFRCTGGMTGTLEAHEI